MSGAGDLNVDAPPPLPQDPPPSPPTAAEAALGRYTARMRRARLIYLAVIGIVVAALAAGVAVVWSRSEIAHVTLHTVRSAPPNLPLAAPSSHPQPAWHRPDHLAAGVPQWNGTVVTWSGHTVRGVDARTGRQTWSYTRTDRTVCAAAQTQGTTVAIYLHGGNCDEVTGLDSGTGARKWTRTLDEDGRPLNGRPHLQVLSDTVVISTRLLIYAIDPGSGLDRWTWYHYGCALRGVVVGSAGALISQTCTKAQSCDQRKFCGAGTQLVFRDATAGYDTDNYPRNPDRVIWNLFGNDDLPASADDVISALNTTTRQLDTFASATGHSSGTVALSPSPASLGPIVAAPASPGELVWIGGRTYALTGTAQSWSAPMAAPPTVVSPGGASLPALDTARITAPASGVVAAYSGRTGRVVRRFALAAAVPPTATVWPLGTGFLVGSGPTTAAYR